MRSIITRYIQFKDNYRIWKKHQRQTKNTYEKGSMPFVIYEFFKAVVLFIGGVVILSILLGIFLGEGVL